MNPDGFTVMLVKPCHQPPKNGNGKSIPHIYIHIYIYIYGDDWGIVNMALFSRWIFRFLDPHLPGGFEDHPIVGISHCSNGPSLGMFGDVPCL
jgi:hypothetical protein